MRSYFKSKRAHLVEGVLLLHTSDAPDDVEVHGLIAAEAELRQSRLINAAQVSF